MCAVTLGRFHALRTFVPILPSYHPPPQAAVAREAASLRRRLDDVGEQRDLVGDAAALLDLADEAGGAADLEAEAMGLLDRAKDGLERLGLRLDAIDHGEASALVEIQAGAGGADAELWAGNLLSPFSVGGRNDFWCSLARIDLCRPPPTSANAQPFRNGTQTCFVG